MVLQGLSHVICYLDDILITGANEEEHIRNVELVLERLRKHGIRARKKKCEFFSKAVEYEWMTLVYIRTTERKLMPFIWLPNLETHRN